MELDAVVEAFARKLGDPLDVTRREVRPELGGEFENPFARERDRRYMAALGRRRMFVNELYLTVVRRRLQGSAGQR